MTTSIKKLIELAEKATQIDDQGGCILWCSSVAIDINMNEAEYIAAACPANLIPILKCAERMAEYLKSSTRHYSLLLELLKEWDELNK